MHDIPYPHLTQKNMLVVGIDVPVLTCPLDVIKALNHQLDAKWKEFGTHLRFEPAILNGIGSDRSGVGDCMLELVEKWVVCENGTGDLPRTWQTVVQAVRVTSSEHLAKQLAEQQGVQLLGQ